MKSVGLMNDSFEGRGMTIMTIRKLIHWIVIAGLLAVFLLTTAKAYGAPLLPFM